ncbi:type II secretion system minor pseudopilin GspK [Marinobacterium rhizophilum]|uniref:type II secretion system minor pseudopilin GspK n=1 Tax=Marinobacterium rhizophilum TaxID=420402 RepID=UPI00035F1943|nr:type II secretion system minor pseudopilin GspK [Marinobacterium rhizophilum]
MTAPPSSRQQNAGVALMIVLLVVAMISLVAVQIGSLLQLGIRQAGNREQYQQAQWFALGGERLARSLIESAFEHDKRIHPGQAWAMPGRRYPIDGGSIRLDIRDQGACFNLNALSALTTDQDGSKQKPPQAVRQLASLIQALGGSEAETAQLLEPLRDWLDEDNLTTGLRGAEDLYYTARQPPYLPANGPLASLSELGFIRGFRRDDDYVPLSEELRPWLCAPPDRDLLLNLNSLGANRLALLSALFEGKVPTDRLTQALNARPAGGFRSADEFWQRLAGDESLAGRLDAQVRPQLRVTSDFFLARIEVNLHETNLVLYSRIQVRNDQTAVYQRHYGALNE